MPTLMSRRAFIPALALGALGAGLSRRAFTASQNTINNTDIADNLTLFTGAGGNVIAHEGPQSVVLIDGGSPEHSSALLSAIAERFAGKPVTTLINTHWHLEQTGSNDILGSSGIPIIAHENTKRWMSTRIEQHWGGQIFQPREAVALPTRTFYLDDEIQHGSETISLGYTPRAHTDGDIYAKFTASNTIAAGGLAYAGSYPIFDTATNGWIGEMLDATRTLLSQANSSTIIVPADGPVLNREHLVAQEEMLADILERFKSYSRKGLGADDMLKEGIADEYVAAWGDPTEFILTAWDGLWDHMRGLGAF